MIFYAENGRYYYQDGPDEFSLPVNEIDIADYGSSTKFVFQRWPLDDSRSKIVKYFDNTSILDKTGTAYGSDFEDIFNGLDSGIVLNDAGGIDVNIQDQTSDVIIQKFNKVTNSTTLNGAVAVDDKQIIVTDATGIVLGSHIIMFDPASVRFSSFTAVGIEGTTITLDNLIDFAYPDGTFVDIGTTNMAVNGAVTPVTFGLRGVGTPPGVELTFDMTRIVITMLTTAAPAFDLFGDIAKLTNGVLFRKRDGKTFNIFNVKSNGEWAGLMYDLSVADKVNPSQGQNGWIGRMTFAGQSKMGVVIRLPIGEDAEFIIQDDLSDIELLEIVAEGHIVVD